MNGSIGFPMEENAGKIRVYEDRSTRVLEGRRGSAGDEPSTTVMCPMPGRLRARGTTKSKGRLRRTVGRFFRAIVGVFQRKRRIPLSAAERILELSSGKNLKDHYDVDSVLQHGAFSDVHRGRNKITRLEVAIKVIKGRCLDEHREVEIMMDLNHKNIVQFHGVFLDGNTFAIVMELMEADLRMVVDFSGPLGEDKEMAITFEVLQALVYLEKRGVVHYDIKQRNILLSTVPEVSVKITDFGLSELVSVDTGKRGSHPYKSPDVVRAAWRPCQPQSDVWGVGITVLAMCLGQPPLNDLSWQEYDQLLEEMTTYPLNQAMQDCKEERSPAWWDLVRRCLVVDPAQRQPASQLISHQALNLRADLALLRPHIILAKNTNPGLGTPDSDSFPSLEEWSLSSKDSWERARLKRQTFREAALQKRLRDSLAVA